MRSLERAYFESENVDIMVKSGLDVARMVTIGYLTVYVNCRLFVQDSMQTFLE